jgi:hypothetical protein
MRVRVQLLTVDNRFFDNFKLGVVKLNLNHSPLYHALQLSFVWKHCSKAIASNAYHFPSPFCGNQSLYIWNAKSTIRDLNYGCSRIIPMLLSGDVGI